MTVDNNVLLLLKSSGIGDGEPDLGEQLMGSFLDMLLDEGPLPARIICMSTGIYLTTEGTPVKKQMQQFADAGTMIFSCATCLEYYDRKEKLLFGRPGNMRQTVRAMKTYKTVLSP